jgi:WD40 repeat protein
VRTLKSRSRVLSLRFSPDGNLMAAGTSDPGLELWDLRGAAESRTLKAAGDAFDVMPGIVAFSPDSHYVVTDGHGKDIAVFDTATGSLVTELRAHIHPATAIVFLPDGRLLSGGGERALRLWDVKQSQLLATWFSLPADANQNWPDEWVGYKPSGQFAGSMHLDRLRGWKLGEDIVIGPEDGARRRRVETLFQSGGSRTAE